MTAGDFLPVVNSLFLSMLANATAWVSRFISVAPSVHRHWNVHSGQDFFQYRQESSEVSGPASIYRTHDFSREEIAEARRTNISASSFVAVLFDTQALARNITF